MKQEHKFVAELYRYLAPFIDTNEHLFISLDGQAAIGGVGGVFTDATIPDLWFTFIGKNIPVLIEAKTIDTDGRMLLMKSQLEAWRSNGVGAHKPEYWVAVNREFNVFYFWEQEEFLYRLDNSRANTKTLTLLPPDNRIEFNNVSELALHILKQA